MNRIRKLLGRALPHIVIVLSLVILTLVIINYYNPYMQFIENAGTQTMTGLLCVLSVTVSLLLIRKNRDK